MNFSDALIAMKEGKKIRLPRFEDDVYYLACRVGVSFSPVAPFPLSIAKMKGDRQHPDMLDIRISGKLFATDIMSDDWEIISED